MTAKTMYSSSMDSSSMTSRERMLTALNLGVPDRVPVTIHQWQPYHLSQYMGGATDIQAFRQVGLDAAITIWDANTDKTTPHWQVETHTSPITEGNWRIDTTIHTPEGILTQHDEANEKTTWTVDYLIKRPEDMLLVKKYLPVPRLDQEFVRSRKRLLGEDGILRGLVFGEQAGPWQHAASLYGVEKLIMATFDEPGWVHELLESLTEKKLQFIEQSLTGAEFDLIEMGGGAASSSVISPKIFKEFCLPYDRALHDALHGAGHKVVYHTCGGMMAILDLIVENGCDASETLSPAGVGGDAVAEEIKRRIGDKVCLIGGMDQVNILSMGTPAEIRAEVHRLFEAFGPRGGYMLSASDHFFDAPVENLLAFARAGRECIYS
jgi:uroporphyrinogen-III decarboxylase